MFGFNRVALYFFFFLKRQNELDMPGKLLKRDVIIRCWESLQKEQTNKICITDTTDLERQEYSPSEFVICTDLSCIIAENATFSLASKATVHVGTLEGSL